MLPGSDATDSTPLFTAVAVNVCSPGLILSGTVKVTVQTPLCIRSDGETCYLGAICIQIYRFSTQVEVPVIVMPSVQSVSSPWASIVGGQFIMNVTSSDVTSVLPCFDAVATSVNVP